MTADEVEELITRTPFAPFRLILSDGGSITVRKPRKANVTGNILAVSGIARRKAQSAGIQGLNLVYVDQIIDFEITSDEH